MPYKYIHSFIHSFTECNSKGIIIHDPDDPIQAPWMNLARWMEKVPVLLLG
jgi:hypothetical protein